MELEQLHEAGSSQADLRTAAEAGIVALSGKVSQLEEAVLEKKTLFEEADGEREWRYITLHGSDRIGQWSTTLLL